MAKDTNFLKTDGYTYLKDFQHASKLFVGNDFANAPKVNFLFYVVFNINSSAIYNDTWKQGDRTTVGLLVKKIDLPKFAIQTEIINQYNRKALVQTKLNYTNVNVEFHDDNSDITTSLWKNYYQYYFTDSLYKKSENGERSIGFSDTK